MQSVSAAAQGYIANVTSDNWWWVSTGVNGSDCESAIFTDLPGGSLEIRSPAPYANNISFSAIPWKRIGLEGAYENLPASLPGLSAPLPPSLARLRNLADSMRAQSTAASTRRRKTAQMTTARLRDRPPVVCCALLPGLLPISRDEMFSHVTLILIKN
jgi:hypothetical protein